MNKMDKKEWNYYIEEQEMEVNLKYLIINVIIKYQIFIYIRV